MSVSDADHGSGDLIRRSVMMNKYGGMWMLLAHRLVTG